MCRHEDKYCPRCNRLFECKLGNILQCQCFGISFTDAEKERIGKTYTDCLCRQCLLDIKNELLMQPNIVSLQKDNSDV